MILPDTWAPILKEQLEAPSFHALCAFLEAERAQHLVHPASEHVLAALEATPWQAVKVVLLGQDPYPTPGHAHGLCFSVQPGVKLPGSLRNMYKELADDLGIPPASTGHLAPWARQGILMLNAVLTVRSGAPNSHKGKGWEPFTDTILRKLSERETPVVFVLWGNAAQKKRALIDESRHVVIAGAHPSPLSQKLWFGSRPFSRINDALVRLGHTPIDWRLDNRDIPSPSA